MKRECNNLYPDFLNFKGITALYIQFMRKIKKDFPLFLFLSLITLNFLFYNIDFLNNMCIM